jgi:hypothetical protein
MHIFPTFYKFCNPFTLLQFYTFQTNWNEKGSSDAAENLKIFQKILDDYKTMTHSEDVQVSFFSAQYIFYILLLALTRVTRLGEFSPIG